MKDMAALRKKLIEKNADVNTKNVYGKTALMMAALMNHLEVVKELQKINSKSKIIMLTGYGNIPTAVAAIKQGAIDYLAKPADADDIEKALLADPKTKAQPPENPMSADRVKWEHIHRVFELCNRNVSETARRLKMYRRTLQRILYKRSPK